MGANLPIDLIGPKGFTHGWVYHGPGHGTRARTSRLVRADVARASGKLRNASPSLIANRATAALKGKRGSDYQHLAAARLHAAAARSASSPELQSRHQQMAKMHRGIAARNVGRQTASEGPVRQAPKRRSGPPTFTPPAARAELRRRALAKSASAPPTWRKGLTTANTGPAVELARHKPIDPKIPLGSGGRFKKMKAKLAARGARNPGALAAYIGRRAYGRKKFAALGAKGRSHAHANTGPALEFAVPDAPVFPVSGPLDLLISRDPEDGSAVVRHRRGGGEIGRIRHSDDGQWRASRDGKDLGPHIRQRGALLELIGAHNKTAPSPYRRQPAPAAEPLQPRAEQTPLMQAYGIPAVNAHLANTDLAASTPVAGTSDGPRVTTGLGARGKTIYGKLRKRGFPHDRAHNFARRAERKATG